MGTRFPRVLVALVCLTLANACGSASSQVSPADISTEAEQAPDATLRLSLEERSGDLVTVRLDYARGAEQANPRMMELWLQLEGPVEFLSADAGLATTNAGKQLVVQSKDNGRLRVVVFSAQNTEHIDSGAIAHLRLRRHGVGRLAIERQLPFFAPNEANAGVRIAPPLNIDG